MFRNTFRYGADLPTRTRARAEGNTSQYVRSTGDDTFRETVTPKPGESITGNRSSSLEDKSSGRYTG